MVLADASNTARKRGGATVARRPPNPPRRSWILCAPASTTNRFTQMPASSGPNRSLTSEEIASNGSTGSIPVRVARQYDAPVSHPGGVLATQEVERPGVRTLHLRLATHHMARSSNGRTAAPHAADAGSNPVRVTTGRSCAPRPVLRATNLRWTTTRKAGMLAPPGHDVIQCAQSHC